MAYSSESMSASEKRRSTSRSRRERAPIKEESHGPDRTWANEVLGVLCLLAGTFLLVSLISRNAFLLGLSATPPADDVSANILGPAGHVSATMLGGLFGWSSLMLGAALLWAGVFIWRNELWMNSLVVRSKSVLMLAVVGFFICAAAFGFCFWGRSGGGSLGAGVGGFLMRLIGQWGAATVLGVCLLTCAAVATKRSFADVIKGIFSSTLFVIGFLFGTLPVMLFGVLRAAGNVAGTFGRFVYLAVTGVEYPQGREREERDEEPVEVYPKRRSRKAAESGAEGSSAKLGPIEVETLSDDPEPESFSHVVVSRRKPENAGSEREKARRQQRAAAAEHEGSEPDFGEYTRPDLDFLKRGEVQTDGEDDSELLAKSRIIEAKLKDFGIQGRITQVHPGPVVTLFEFEPAPGVKVGKIASLQDDLAMSLRAVAIRVIAPIPNKGTVGIEVPNKHREIVRLRDLLESQALGAEESKLAIPIGKDTYGDPIVADIASMPHLLVAGATGTGKSVCINTILMSLLYRTSPADLGLILIDPKILELSIYEGIPHLRVPVVTDPRQAKAVLQWAVKEMERRYRMMQKFGVRNVDGYNAVVRGDKVDGEIIKPPAQEELFGEQLEEIPVDLTSAAQEEGAPLEPKKSVVGEELKPLSKIVIVIDELADLMLTVGREIEELITRLAQKARAAGIHLIVATQRPSVDVITGLIKANFPARLSFRVTSRIDSRTILDSMGAEKLLGRGDMLVMFPGAVHIRRVHGAFVEDSEVKKVITAIKANSKPQYDQRIIEMCEKALAEDSGQSAGGAQGEEQEYDEFYDKAVELVLEKGTASTSMIQRVFRIGYNRAARIIEVMERDGIIGPMDGVKPREVLIQSLDERAAGEEAV